MNYVEMFFGTVLFFWFGTICKSLDGERLQYYYVPFTAFYVDY